MMTPYRGGRNNSRGRGSGRSNTLLRPEQTVPLLGDLSTPKKQPTRQLPPYFTSQTTKEIPSEVPSSSSTSYKDAAVKEMPPELEYFENPITEHVLYLEHDDVKMTPKDGWSLATRYLESRGYPGLHGKARPNLEILLTITGSITITHHYQNNNPDSFINFSKCHINKILLPREWGLNPNGEKAIRVAEGKYIYFNYWDYVEAFSKAFYYQNPKNKHSWFFSINPEILEKPIPNWFFEWWSKFGPSLEILPQEVNDLYKTWYDYSPLTSSGNLRMFGQCPFLFITKFQVPWIWRWTFSIAEDKLQIPILRRNFFFKWWGRMPNEDIQVLKDKIQKVINNDKATMHQQPANQHVELAKLKEYLQRKYPTESEGQITVRALDFMKQQFLAVFPEQSAHTTGDAMETSSQDSMNPNSFQVLAGESQDEDEEPTLGDYWDSLIGAVSQQTQGPRGESKFSN